MLTDYNKQEIKREFNGVLSKYISEFDKNKSLSNYYNSIINHLTKQIYNLYNHNKDKPIQELDFKISKINNTKTSEILNISVDSPSMNECILIIPTHNEFELLIATRFYELHKDEIVLILNQEFSQFKGHSFIFTNTTNGIEIDANWNLTYDDINYTIKSAMEATYRRLGINGELIKSSNDHYKLKFKTSLIDRDKVKAIYNHYIDDLKNFIENGINYDELKNKLNEIIISKIRYNLPLNLKFNIGQISRDFNFTFDNDCSIQLNTGKIYKIENLNDIQIFQFRNELLKLTGQSTMKVFIRNGDSLLISEGFESEYIQLFISKIKEIINDISKRLLVTCEFSISNNGTMIVKFIDE